MTTQEKYEQLKKDGKTVYSISRLNAYNTCPYSYDITYNKGDRGENNAYGIAGTEVHDWLEDIQNNELDVNMLPDLFDSLLLQLELEGANFPSAKIGENWQKDMQDFINTFQRLDVDMETEKHVVYEVAPDIWLQGYIDGIGTYKGRNFILDWKTSSMFRGKGLIDAGRQLLLYKDAIEKTTGEEIHDLYWFMIKYIELTFNGRTAVLSRRDWVKKSKKKLEKALEDEPELLAAEYLNVAIEENSIDMLPQYVQDKFIIKPHIKRYDFEDGLMEEARQYVVDTVSKIESDTEWNPCNVSKNNFFCQNLCNHRNSCPHLESYLNR